MPIKTSRINAIIIIMTRYVIFDEVHNIGAESHGETWEHIITLIRCASN